MSGRHLRGIPSTPREVCTVASPFGSRDAVAVSDYSICNYNDNIRHAFFKESYGHVEDMRARRESSMASTTGEERRGREGWQTGTKEGDRGPLRSVGGEGEGQGFRVANGMGREKGTRVN